MDKSKVEIIDVETLIKRLDKRLNDDKLVDLGISILSLENGESVTKSKLFNLIRMYTNG